MTKTMRDIVLNNKKMQHDHDNVFRQIFGADIGQFMHPVFGFDIVKFDDFVGTPGGVSLADYLLSKYGIEAHRLISTLIGGIVIPNDF